MSISFMGGSSDQSRIMLLIARAAFRSLSGRGAGESSM